MEKLKIVMEIYHDWYENLDEEERFHFLAYYPEELKELICQKMNRELSRTDWMKCFNYTLTKVKNDPSELMNMIPLMQVAGLGTTWHRHLLECQEIEEKLLQLSSEILRKIDIIAETWKRLPEYDYENQWLQNYNNIKDGVYFSEIYKFLEYCERSTQFQLMDAMSSVIGLYVYALSEKNWAGLIHIINQRKNVFMIHKFALLLNQKQRLKAALECENFLFIFDVIRSDFYMKPKHIIPADSTTLYIQQYIDLLNKLAADSEVWHETMRYFYQYPARAPEFFYILAKTMKGLQEEKLLEIADQLKVEEINHLIGIENQIWEAWILEEVPEPIPDSWKKFYEIILKKWLKFLGEQTKHCCGEVATVVDKSIRFYVEKIMDRDEREADLIKYKIDIDETANQWFCSEAEQKNHYYRMKTIYRLLSHEVLEDI